MHIQAPASAGNAESQEDEDEDEEEEEEDEENVMYERECELFEMEAEAEGDGKVAQTGNGNSLGSVELKIVYDDDVYGARIVAHRSEDDDAPACNHLIAMQTNLVSGGTSSVGK